MSALDDQLPETVTGQKFTSAHRLHKGYQFDAVFKGSQLRVSGSEFLLLGIFNGSACNRLGMVVGKKTAGPSVQRSRIKRLIRESFRTFDHRAVIHPSLDVVIVTRSGVAKKANHELSAVLASSWFRLFSKASSSS
ncbi:MAG: ribonuclease P protein component [Pseudomonadales bacterium]|nr:ribonuclease P protein component [Pseudomonadales bacterium]MDP5059358.1 ribonuclease P protein component [Pseudomonadales bacterium]